MLRIEKLEAFLLDLPTIRPHVLSMTTMLRQTLCIVRLRCSDGIEGLGEATTIGGLSYGPESPESILLTIETYIAPLLLGSNPRQVASAMSLLHQHIVGNSFAKAAVEMALLDAEGKRCGLPVADLLGGPRRTEIPVAWTLASGDTARDITEAEQMLALRRHRIFKLKIGRRALAQDVQHVAAIKQALGDRAGVRVDVNQAWDFTTALRGIAALQDSGVDLVEQPIAAWNHPGMARLTRRFDVPIMADESLHGSHDAFALAASAAADVFAIKVAPSSGLFAAGRVAAVAEAAGIGLYGGTMLEGSVGTIASAHLCTTLPSLAWGTELFGPLLLTEDFVSTPVVYRDFALQLPPGPGLGISIDEDRFAFFRRDRQKSRSTSLAAAPERSVHAVQG